MFVDATNWLFVVIVLVKINNISNILNIFTKVKNNNLKPSILCIILVQYVINIVYIVYNKCANSMLKIECAYSNQILHSLVREFQMSVGY